MQMPELEYPQQYACNYRLFIKPDPLQLLPLNFIGSLSPFILVIRGCSLYFFSLVDIE